MRHGHWRQCGTGVSAMLHAVQLTVPTTTSTSAIVIDLIQRMEHNKQIIIKHFQLLSYTTTLTVLNPSADAVQSDDPPAESHWLVRPPLLSIAARHRLESCSSCCLRRPL